MKTGSNVHFTQDTNQDKTEVLYTLFEQINCSFDEHIKHIKAYSG